MTEIPAPRKDVKAFLHPFFEEIISEELVEGNLYGLMVHPPSNAAQQFEEMWRRWVRPCVDLSEFKYAYLGAGSSELIRECARQAVNMQNSYRHPIYATPGEYEGWRYYVETMGGTVENPYEDYSQRRGTRYLSNPQSRDGNWMNPEYFKSLMETQDCIVDMAYVNTAPNRKYDVSQANAVIFSASKPLGMFYHRLGIMFCKQPQPALDGNNLWFHNPLSILLAMAIMDEYPCGSLHAMMQRYQMAAITHYALQGMYMAPSDSFLTGFDRRRDKGYLRPGTDMGNRYCLFPYYEAIRKEMK